MDRLTEFKVADLIAEQIITDNYWDLFTAEEIKPLEPIGRLFRANHVYKSNLAKMLKKK